MNLDYLRVLIGTYVLSLMTYTFDTDQDPNNRVKSFYNTLNCMLYIIHLQ
jgi:hypothetical protein